MRTLCFLLLLLLLLGAAGSEPTRVDLAAAPDRPVWPGVYTVAYEVSLPYLYLQQPEGLKFPVEVWYDKPNKRMRVEVLNGVDTVIYTQNVEYTLYPRINETRCGVFTHGPAPRTSDPALPRSLLATLTGLGVQRTGEQAGPSDWGDDADATGDSNAAADDVDEFLPDLADWDWGGSIMLDGELVHLWQKRYREGTKVSQYTFYVSADGRPIKFLSVGVQYWTGGHFDEYNFVFKKYLPNTLPPARDIVHPKGPGMGSVSDPFTPPAICQDVSGRRVQVLDRRHPVALQVHALTPRAHRLTSEHAYHAFARVAHGTGLEEVAEALAGAGPFGVLEVGRRGRAHTAARAVYQRRLAAFARNVEMIRAHNADASQTFKMGVNRFADWDEEEFQAVLLPNKARRAAQGEAGRRRRAPLGVLSSGSEPLEKLPAAVDWRGTGADAGVKSQAMCGSCFAFSATAAMEGAWYVQTGQSRSFSEQQVLDCSWDYGTNGCGGGDYQDVFDFVAEQGGIALEQDYPYLSNSDFCRANNVTRVGQFKGWVEVKHRDERALMKAVASYGPVAVAVDAEWASFRFYAEGVYTDPRCRIKSSQLDHAVVLNGYGTTDEGEDYWLVKNTWSAFYGDDGHIKIKRGPQDCGISSDAAIAIVQDDMVVPGMRERKVLEAVSKW